MSEKIILLAGPTASGKSKLAIEIAKKIKGEIINADSMQVYKDFSVLSSRPTKADLKKITHHLYGFLSSKKHFSTGAWLSLVKEKIELCLKKKKVPILVGGTGLYFEAITKGMSKIPNIDFRLRNKARTLQAKLGQQEFYKELVKVDPLVKNKIEPFDTQRSIRAYEVKKFTKKSLFEWFANTKSLFKQEDFIKIYIEYPRSKLISKINKRVERMIKSGAIIEVKKFKKMNVNLSNSSNKLIGINEIEQYLKEVISLEKMIELISIRTRQYAKRQSTWSRGQMKDWKKISTNNLNFFLLSLKLVQN